MTEKNDTDGKGPDLDPFKNPDFSIVEAKQALCDGWIIKKEHPRDETKRGRDEGDKAAPKK